MLVLVALELQQFSELLDGASERLESERVPANREPGRHRSLTPMPGGWPTRTFIEARQALASFAWPALQSLLAPCDFALSGRTILQMREARTCWPVMDRKSYTDRAF